MLIDFKKPILDLKSVPMKDSEGKPFLLGVACQEALTAAFQDEVALLAAEKVKRFLLALKIEGALPVDISIEEAVEIKKLVGKAYGSLIVGRVYEIFDAAFGSKNLQGT